MEHTATLPHSGGLIGKVLRSAGQLVGGVLSARAKRVTYTELMNLSDRQLEDIGMTRALIETVVMQGPASVRPLQPEGAIQSANNDRARGIA